MRNLFFLSITLFSLLSCNRQENSALDGTYIGGAIRKPLTNSIIIERAGVVIDTVLLDENNRFLYKFKNFTPGLYTLKHFERQLIYLEKNDSLMLNCDTDSFDETMGFSGFGAFENNFLSKLFLLNEKENRFMIKQKIYQKDPEDFVAVLDSLQQIRFNLWREFKIKHDVSPAFEKIVEATNTFDFYARKEVYPLSLFGKKDNESINNLPAQFCSYRDEADLNREEFLDLYSYQRFLFNYFHQAAYKEYNTQSDYNTLSFKHNIHKLRLIDNTVKNPAVKDFLISHCIKGYLANSNDINGGQVLYDMYVDHIQNPVIKEGVEKLYASNKKIESGRDLPNLKLVSEEDQVVQWSGLVNKPTVFYFWSKKSKSHFKRAHRRVDTLIKKYPEYNFYAINIDQDKEEYSSLIKRYNFDEKSEFRFKCKPEVFNEEIALNSIYKTFIVNPKGTILNAHANLLSSTFEKELDKYLALKKPAQ